MNPFKELLFMNDMKLYGFSKDQLEPLDQVSRIFVQNIRMSVGLDKCAVLEIRGRRQSDSSRRIVHQES